MVLALGLLTSPTILALSHIFIAVPALYFIPKTKYKKMSASFWALLVLIIILALSVVVNLSIAGNGVKPLFKLKYFLFGVGAIAPFTWWFNKFSTDKKLSQLIYVFGIATCIATLAGLAGTWFGFNPVLFKKVEIGSRYGGLFGMVMNYAHNMSFFLIIATGLVIYRERLKHLVTTHFLVVTLIINLVGFYFCYTRGAWLAYLAGLPFFLFNKNKKVFCAAVVLVVALGAGRRSRRSPELL
jgi:hypothetical protein